MLHASSTTSVSRRSLLTAVVAGTGLAALGATALPAIGAPARAHPMQFGMAATPSPFASHYARQVRQLQAECCYVYWPAGANTVWSNGPSSVPDHHDIWLQTKDTTYNAFRATLATFPKRRTGRVFFHYHNEPENDIEDGGLSLRQWQSRCDALFAAIDDSDRPYIRKSVELMYYTLQLHNKKVFGPQGARRVDHYMRPGLQHMGWSCYAEKKVSNGHEVASISPVIMPETLKTFMDRKGLPWSTAATGWALDRRFQDDPRSVANRADWMIAAARNLERAGARHFMWFNVLWANGDYRIESDPRLLAAWNRLVG